MIEIARLLRNIREEVIGLLFNRHVFRTHQEIVRFNSRLQGHPRSIFSEWAQVVYAVATTSGIRRLASASYEVGDVNLVKFFDMLIRDPGQFWSSFERHWPADASKARAGALREAGELAEGWEILACRRLLSKDRKMVINIAEKANRFASKRAVHSVPDEPVSTTFSDLDAAIDVLKALAEKYTLLVCSAQRDALEPLHRAGLPTDYALLARLEKRDLLEEMKTRKLPEGWDAIFLEPWATPEIIALPLGETPPPKRAASG
jgi:hypothetical protein